MLSGCVFMHVFMIRSIDGSCFLQVAWAGPHGAQAQLTLYVKSKDAWQLPVLNKDPLQMHTVNAIIAFTSGIEAGTEPRLCVALPPGAKLRAGEHVVCAVGSGALCMLLLVIS